MRVSANQLSLQIQGPSFGSRTASEQSAFRARGERTPPLSDDATDDDRAPRERPHLRLALGRVRVEDPLVGLAADDGRELPAQVPGVPHARSHALTNPRRHDMRSVAEEESPALPPALGEADVAIVSRAPA